MGAIEDFVGYISSFCNWLVKSERDAVKIYNKGWFWAVATVIILFFFILLLAGLRQA